MNYDIQIHFKTPLSLSTNQLISHNLSKNLLTSFCHEFPAHYIDYLRSYREKYCTDISTIYEDFNQLEINSQSPHVNIIHEHYFKKFCSDMEKIVGEAAISQHFLMFILSCDVTQWNFYTKEDNDSFFFILKGNQFERALVPQQLSLLSALFESSLLSTIYPNIEILDMSLSGQLFIPLFSEVKHFVFSKITLEQGIVHTKHARASFDHNLENLEGIEDYIDWSPFVLDFSYFHKPFNFNDIENSKYHFDINSLYHEKQKEVLSLFDFLKLRQKLPEQEKKRLQNKI